MSPCRLPHHGWGLALCPLPLPLCSPKIQAIRSATADLLLGIGPVPATIAISKPGTATSFQVRGEAASRGGVGGREEGRS